MVVAVGISGLLLLLAVHVVEPASSVQGVPNEPGLVARRLKKLTLVALADHACRSSALLKAKEMRTIMVVYSCSRTRTEWSVKTLAMLVTNRMDPSEKGDGSQSMTHSNSPLVSSSRSCH